MRFLLITLTFLIFFKSPAQETMTPNKWQEDLRFLQQTIHAEYPFLFVKTTKKEFDTEVEVLYKEIPNLQDHEIIVKMSKVIALFKYGHTGIWFNHKPFEFHYLPFTLYQFSDGIYLQGVHKDYPEALGAKVVAINTVPIADALSVIAPVVNAENDQYFKAYGINYLGILEVLHAQGITGKLEKSIELTLVKDGKTFKQMFVALPRGEGPPNQYGFTFQNENWLEARSQNETPLYLKHLDKVYFFEYLAEEKAVYVRHSQIQDDPGQTTEQFYTEVFDFIKKNGVEKLVIDVRLNGGGNNFLNKPIIKGLIKLEQINQVGHLFVITGRRTFSACQNLVNEMDNYTNPIFVGEGTAENINFWGDNQRIDLPNSKLPVYLSYAWWQDKAAWDNAEGTAAMVPADMSFLEYTNNQDPILQAALGFEDSDFKRDPMGYITELYMAGDMQKLAEEVPKLVYDPRYSFVDFEAEFSKQGLRMLRSGRMPEVQAAIQILTMVTQLFPNSAGAWTDLAEGYLKVGDNDKAVEYLNKAISMDGKGEAGRQAKKMLAGLN